MRPGHLYELRHRTSRDIGSRSRDAPWHPKSGHTTIRKPFQTSPLKEGRRSAESASTEVRSAAEGRKPACGRGEHHRFSLPHSAGAKAAAPSPFGAPPRSCAEGLTLRLGLGRASWNRRVQTGGPSPAPVQRAPRSPVKRRTGRCLEPPGYAVYGRVSENRSRSTFESTLAKGPSVNEMKRHVIDAVTDVKSSSPKKR